MPLAPPEHRRDLPCFALSETADVVREQSDRDTVFRPDEEECPTPFDRAAMMQDARAPLVSFPILQPKPTPKDAVPEGSPEGRACGVRRRSSASRVKKPGLQWAKPNRTRSSAVERKPPEGHL